jgi:(p)ppGpp synthase/HD superfamily hydrolase
MAMLERAIQLATQAHQGQHDKAGAPYILHPLRIMFRMVSEAEMIVAVLHDVIEDSEITLSDLRRAGFAEPIVAALDCLTHRAGETYDEYIERIMSNPLAVRIKVADVEDNMDIRRIKELHEHDIARLKKYREVWSRLTAGLDVQI